MPNTIPARPRRKVDPEITARVDAIIQKVDTNPKNYEPYKPESRLSDENLKLLEKLKK